MSQYSPETEYMNRLVVNKIDITSGSNSPLRRPEKNSKHNIFDIGSKCLIKSQSLRKWYLGLVVDIDGSMVTVRYFSDNTQNKVNSINKRQKQLDLSSKNDLLLIKQFTPCHMSFVKHPFCLCEDKRKMEQLPIATQQNSSGEQIISKKHKSVYQRLLKRFGFGGTFEEKLISLLTSDKFNSAADKTVREEINILLKSANESDGACKYLNRNCDDIVCSICNNVIKNNLGYYCPNGDNRVHHRGFNLCLDCVMNRMGFSIETNANKNVNNYNDNIIDNKPNNNNNLGLIINNNNNNNNNNNDMDEKDSVVNNVNVYQNIEVRTATIIGDEPFAQGSSMYAYLGKDINGQLCVIKQYSNEHVMQCDKFDAEFRCFSKARELIHKWNKLNIVKKKDELVIPTLVYRPDLLQELLKSFVPQLFVKPEMAVIKIDRKYDGKLLRALFDLWKDEKRRKKKDKEIISGELVIIEPYLNGTFTKWNSNGGWQNPESESASVQAFCHWTYHESGEKLLFCDAQGINKFDKYILTDPCIVSNKDFARDKNGNIINENEEQTYGVTDTGREFLLNWFRNHKCNEYCNYNTIWAKPREIEMDNIPPALKNVDKVRSSVFNSEVQGIGSVTLGSGSILGVKQIRNNYVVGGIDYANSKHIYENERIIKIGQMLVTSNEENEDNEDCVMILTTLNRIVVVWTANNDDSKTDDSNDQDQKFNDEEFTQKNVKKIELVKNNKYKFHIFVIIKKGRRTKGLEKWVFECRDRNRAQEWKRDIDKAFKLQSILSH